MLTRTRWMIITIQFTQVSRNGRWIKNDQNPDGKMDNDHNSLRLAGTWGNKDQNPLMLS